MKNSLKMQKQPETDKMSADFEYDYTQFLFYWSKYKRMFFGCIKKKSFLKSLTLAPSFRSKFAVAKPIPEAPPVTNATFSFI